MNIKATPVFHESIALADLMEGAQGRVPPRRQNSFLCMHFSGKIGKIMCWRTPGELAPSPPGTPESSI